MRKRIVATLKFIRYNDATIVSGSALMRELEKTAAAGYALDNGEQFDRVYCVGTPVFDRGGYPIASIWTTGLMMDLETSRVPELGEYARVCALKISRRLGYNGASERICSV